MARVAAPLASHRVLSTTSIDAARVSVAASLAPHRLTPLRRDDDFRARHHAVDLGDLSLHFIDYGCEVEVGVDGLDFQLVQIPLAGRARIRAGGDTVEVGPGTAALTPLGRALQMRYSCGNPRVMVRIAGGLLRERTDLARATGVLPAAPGVQSLDLTRGAARTWRGVVDLVLADLDRPDGLASVPSAAAALQTALVDGLVAAVAPRCEAPVATPQERVVLRAARLIEEHCAEPLGTPDVAEAVHLSVRALQAGFRAHLDTTPTAYLRRVRLERVRASLLDGSASSVTEAALRWGAGHLGRLSGDYRAAFGETPSETLRRR
ncbi:helix-turn-helix domain-containing protein [Nocardioides zeae]|uniref:AraC family transcriptional regulator n=1 Tax=Nocardioides zeae TaxID=1457234 RepID=A0A6P0HME3_9ACTN|nr:AraC family transcriptional regulator [Nocardioides zeae]